MTFFDFLSMVGGLAMFLFGMETLGANLSKMAGGKMQAVLSRLTTNKYMGILLGAVVTAVIQSSSATTVMVVGFVNSGIMELSQAVGIILGANIGTTATSWILSLAGISGDGFFVQLLKPSSFTPVMGIIGICFIMFSKKDSKHNVGGILIGFMVLMAGMETMSSAVSGLKDVPEFTRVLVMFSNPIIGVIVGAVITAVIQSSSASVGILQALSATGQVTFGSAVPIIMGQNIGTCVTAMISSIGASKNARRTAFIHLYFNLIGTVVFMILFYVLNAVLKFSFMEQAATGAGIATIHSVFNITATVLWLPFTKQLEKLARITVKEDEVSDETDQYDKELMALDDLFLTTPSFAVEVCFDVTKRMAEISREALTKSLGLLEAYSENGYNEVCYLEDVVDRFEDRLGTYLVKVGELDLNTEDSHTVTMMMHCIGDIERISDHAIGIANVVKKMVENEQQFSKKAGEELRILIKAVNEITDNAVRSFETEDVMLAAMVEPLEETIDYVNEELKKRHIKRLRKGKCTIELGLQLTELITNVERVADHCSNIAVCLIQIKENSFDTHEYLGQVKAENKDYKSMYEAYVNKYQLP